MTPTLRQYQQDLDLETWLAFEFIARRVLLVLPTGGGKTVLFTKIAADQKGVTWIIAHRQELIRQASETLDRFGIDHGTVKSGFPFQPEKRVQVASMQTIVRRAATMPPPELIILDECFPAGTLVDGCPIESIRKGDMVWSFNHDTGREELREVLGLMVRQHGGLWFRITADDGSQFVCTENHPVFVEGVGYVPAKQIHEHLLCHLRKFSGSDQTDKLETPEILQLGLPSQGTHHDPTEDGVLHLRKNIHSGFHGSSGLYEAKGPSLLLSGMRTCGDGGELQKDHGRNESEICVRADEKEEPDAHSRNLGEDAEFHEGSEIQRARREREDHAAARSPGPSEGFTDGVGDPDKRCFTSTWEAPEQLQGGHRSPEAQTGSRGGREGAHAPQDKTVGRQEGPRPPLVRLASVEVYERGSGPRPSWVPEQDTVHNIHVEGNNNYYAEGVLVHNCHHALCPTIGKILAAAPRAKVLGVTATPCRTTGAGLGSVFDHMIIGPTNRWLTDQGFLSPAFYYAPPPKADVSNLPMRSGDYAREAAEAAMDKAVVTGDAVEHYRRICDGVPMLSFCVSVEHAKHVAAQYTEAGYRAAAVDGALDDDERKDRILGLATGKYQVITSCDLIGEGLDVPVVGAVQLLRPTASLSLHLQQIGRGLRPAEGKEACYVLDHVGNVAKHRFASTEHPWSLQGTVKPRKEKAESVRTCGACFMVHETAKTCPFCGFEYPVKSRVLSKMEIVDGELVRIEETKEERAEALTNARTRDELVAFAKARNYKRPKYWARMVYQGRSYLHYMPKMR